MPFEFKPSVMDRMKAIFFKDKWEVVSPKSQDENYSYQASENPFIAFKDIPAHAR